MMMWYKPGELIAKLRRVNGFDLAGERRSEELAHFLLQLAPPWL
jgi:hypothetical protein